jgi:hypothetical protein
MPAYNAQTTLEQTVADIPPGCIDEIILVDDCSRDETVAMARRLGLTVIQHERNLGYGGNQKTCYREALARDADVVIMIHPDYQYDSRLVPVLVGLLRNGHCDVVLGNRIRTRREALAGGMPAYKYFANRILTIIENLWMGQNLGECHSGTRLPPGGPRDHPVAGQQRRFRVRQPVPRAGRPLRVPHRGHPGSRALHEGGEQHQFPPEREVRPRNPGRAGAVDAAPAGPGAHSALRAAAGPVLGGRAAFRLDPAR